MGVLYARPTTVNYTKAADQDVHHVVKLLEADNLPDLETAVNAYLLGLEQLPGQTNPAHVQSIALTHYETGPPGKDVFHVATIHLIPVGDIP